MAAWLKRACVLVFVFLVAPPLHAQPPGIDPAATSATTTPTLAGSTTALTLSSSTSGILQPVALTATVAAIAPAAGTPTGAVQFMDGSTTLGTVSVSATGVALLIVNGLTAGPHTLTAVYGGDAAFSGSTSTGATLTVAEPAASTFTRVIAVAFSAGQTTVFTAFVQILAGAAPALSGTVQFRDGGAPLGAPEPVQNGLAFRPVSTLSAGLHFITARYTDATLGSSAAPPVLHTVFIGTAPWGVSVNSVASSPNPATLGQVVTLTATVASNPPPPEPPPIGVVVFFADGVPIGSAQVVTDGGTGTATLSTTALSRGFHVITASFVGTGGIVAGASGNSLPILQAVQ